MGIDYHASVSLTVSAIGPGTLSYKWKRNKADIDDEDYTGVGEPILTIPSFSLKHEGLYLCEVNHDDQMFLESKTAQLVLSKTQQIKLSVYISGVRRCV